MLELAVGQAVMMNVKRWFCECITKTGEEVFLTVKATSEAEASALIHQGYEVDCIIDILSPLQMEYRKRHLRPSLLRMTSLK